MVVPFFSSSFCLSPPRQAGEICKSRSSSFRHLLLTVIVPAAAIDFRLQQYIIKLCRGKQLPMQAREIATRKD
jgi:hypothetical protein